jgi:hypothetical protein
VCLPAAHRRQGGCSAAAGRSRLSSRLPALWLLPGSRRSSTAASRCRPLRCLLAQRLALGCAAPLQLSCTWERLLGQLAARTGEAARKLRAGSWPTQLGCLEAGLQAARVQKGRGRDAHGSMVLNTWLPAANEQQLEPRRCIVQLLASGHWCGSTSHEHLTSAPSQTACRRQPRLMAYPTVSLVSCWQPGMSLLGRMKDISLWWLFPLQLPQRWGIWHC